MLSSATEVPGCFHRVRGNRLDARVQQFRRQTETPPFFYLRDPAAANSSAIETAGEIFGDGTVIEILRDPASPEKFTLVRSQRGVFI